MKKDVVDSRGGFVIEQTGPNGWSIIGTGALIGIALTIIALALLELATWAGIALIIVAVGQAALRICQGAALIIAARNERARVEGEIWREVARRQRLAPPGPEAQRDIERLWGKEKNTDR